MKLRKRRQFIQLMGISSILVALGDWGSRSLAQEIFQISGSVIKQSKEFIPEFSLDKTLELLLNELETATPNSILSVEKVESAKITSELLRAENSRLSSELKNKSPEQVDTFLESLNQVFYFNQQTGELTKNPKIYLTSGQEKVVEELINGFKEQLETNQISLDRQSDNLFIPITETPELTFIEPLSFESVLNESQIQKESIDEAQRSCRWQWSKKTYWWGLRITLNRCLLDRIRLLLGGGATAAGIASVFGFPIIVAGVLVGVIAILDKFSNSNGVRIYITWLAIITRITGA